MLCSEMRDGNVPASMDNLRVLVDALKRLPPEICTVRVRSDSAGHDNALMAYCNTPQCRPEADNTRRFGTIHFVISTRMSQDLGDAMRAMPETDWRALDCAEEAQADMTARLADGDGATLAVARYCGEVQFPGQDALSHCGRRPKGSARSMEQVPQTARSHRLHHEPGLGNHTGSVRLKARRTDDSRSVLV